MAAAAAAAAVATAGGPALPAAAPRASASASSSSSSCAWPVDAQIEVRFDEEMQVPVCDIPRLRYPEDLASGRFELDFVAQSKACIIEGLVDDWAAVSDGDRTWRRVERLEQQLGDELLDCGFDPKDSRMMHFGDEEGEPEVLFNPGRLRMPAWAFLEIAKLRQELLQLQDVSSRSRSRIDLKEHPHLKERLQRPVEVTNMPFLKIDEDSPLQHFAPVQCRLQDLVPLSFYLSHDTYSLPEDMQRDLHPQASKIMQGWKYPNSSRIWMTNGGPWRLPYPAWSPESVPEPGHPMIYSCMHCDRMENLHSIIAGEKRVVLVPPGQKDVIKATRYAEQRQWLVAPVTTAQGCTYLSSTLFTSKQSECTSDQSAVHPLKPPEVNRQVSGGQWPDKVDFPVSVGHLKKGDTLYIPAYHWHWVATTTPPTLSPEAGRADGPLAISVNFWWWPIHNDDQMGNWSYQNEEESWRNSRSDLSKDMPHPDRAGHVAAFRRLTWRQRQEAEVPKRWPAPAPSSSSPPSPFRTSQQKEVVAAADGDCKHCMLEGGPAQREKERSNSNLSFYSGFNNLKNIVDAKSDDEKESSSTSIDRRGQVVSDARVGRPVDDVAARVSPPSRLPLWPDRAKHRLQGMKFEIAD